MKRRKTTLVSQYLERISGAALEEYQEFFRDFARRRNGVYALYRGQRLYYVGLARDLRGRLKHHLKDRHSKQWDRFSIYLTVGDDHIRELESLVLRVVRPKGNKQMGKFPRAENLQREFARMARADARARLDELLGRKPKRAPKKQKRAVGKKRTPVLAAYPHRSKHLRATYKGNTLRAWVRGDGSITFRGKRFNSPSLAGKAAVGGSRAVNGWSFWKYERAPGDWVFLDQLRK